MKVKKIFKGCIIALIAIIALMVFAVVLIMDYFLIYPPADDYDGSTYSVLVNNRSEETVKNVQILYGGPSDLSKATEFTKIENIEPGQYIKTIIYTDNVPENIAMPYNVFISMDPSGRQVVCPLGYFETNGGGFAVVEIRDTYEGLDFYELPTASRKYHRLYWKHRRHQWELAW